MSLKLKIYDTKKNVVRGINTKVSKPHLCNVSLSIFHEHVAWQLNRHNTKCKPSYFPLNRLLLLVTIERNVMEKDNVENLQNSTENDLYNLPK